jgi:hypothetical protein
MATHYNNLFSERQTNETRHQVTTISSVILVVGAHVWTFFPTNFLSRILNLEVYDIF